MSKKEQPKIIQFQQFEDGYITILYNNGEIYSQTAGGSWMKIITPKD